MPRTVSARLERSRRARSPPRRTNRRYLRSLFRRLGKVQRRRGEPRAGRCARVCHSPRLRSGAGLSTRRLNRWRGDWHGMVCSSIRVGQKRTTRTQVVIEPQVPDYWPRTPPLGNTDVLVLSRFAYMRRRGNEMVLESPRAGALFQDLRSEDREHPRPAVHAAADRTAPPAGRISRDLSCSPCWWTARSCSRSTPPATVTCEPRKATATLFSGTSTICCSTRAALRAGTPTRSADVYSYAAVTPALPAVRRRWPGEAIDLRKLSAHRCGGISPTARLLRERHSVRSFDDERPITLAELARFLDGTARVMSTWESHDRPRRRPPGVRIRDAAVSLGGRKLRARTLSRGRQMRRPRARILSLRRRPACAGADRRAHATSGSAVQRERSFPWARPPRRKSSSPSRRGSAGCPGNTARSPMRSS